MPKSAARSLNRASLSHLHAEIRRRQSALKRLQRRRDALASKLHALNNEIAGLGGIAKGGTTLKGRPRNAMNLVEALAQTLAGKTMGVSEVAEAVQENGYATTSPNFRTIVNATLLKHRDRFKNVARGQYTAK